MRRSEYVRSNVGPVIGVIAMVVIIAAIVLSFLAFGTVEAGHRGVVLRMGAVKGDVKGEGFYTKIPFLERIVEMDCRVQKEQVKTEGASKDLQMVHTVVACNISLSPARCAEIYQTVGVDYLTKIVEPSMQESIKAILAQYTAEELISKREAVRNAISTLLATKLGPLGLKTDAVNIVDFDFSSSFNQAIEAKVTAEQNALAARNKLEQVRFEAEQKIAEAKGKAEAMQLEAAALMRSPQILQLRTLEKWDGKLPHVTGGAVPFIDIK